MSLASFELVAEYVCIKICQKPGLFSSYNTTANNTFSCKHEEYIAIYFEMPSHETNEH